MRKISILGLLVVGAALAVPASVAPQRGRLLRPELLRAIRKTVAVTPDQQHGLGMFRNRAGAVAARSGAAAAADPATRPLH
jgi:hypothetical protein